MLAAAEVKKLESVETNNTSSNSHGDSFQRQGQSAAATASPAATLPPIPSSVVVGGGSNSTSYELAHFEPVRILTNNSTHKTVSLLGHFSNLSRDEYAIVVLEKTAFTEKQLRNPVTTANSDVETSRISESEQQNATAADGKSFFSAKSQLRTEFVNDIYGNFLCVTDPEINQLKTTIIYPATEKHIVKFEAQARYLVEETAEDYQTVTLPHLEKEQLSLEWVFNILEHRKEKERIVYEDPSDETGFILLPDLKWDGKTVEQLYLLALIRKRGIKSLRDLTPAHLPLLRNIKDRGCEVIKSRYGIGADQLRIHLHYQPSFYHLHVHFTYLKHDPPGINAEKSHLLTTVIGNLELVPDYYQKVTLPCVLRESDNLYKKITAVKGETKEPEAKRARK